VYCSAVFAGGRSLCIEILPGQGRSSSTILGTRKLETLDCRWRRPHLSAFPRFDTIRSVSDGRTDGRICRSTTLAKIALRRAIKISVMIEQFAIITLPKCCSVLLSGPQLQPVESDAQMDMGQEVNTV